MSKSKIQNPKSKILIIGAGVAGASLAIRLAMKGLRVSLVEREKFPRHKLCGEFVSPECFAHFQTLGVLDKMHEIGGDAIHETRFFAPSGKSVNVPSEWFNHGAQGAIGISRAEMDFRLLEKARELGVEISEETSVTNLIIENEKVCGVKVKSKTGEIREIIATLTIDATGRASVLAKFAEKQLHRRDAETQRKAEIQNLKSKIQNRLVGFKAHLKNTKIEKGVCEIYFFRGGYGGLNLVENGAANHCFLLDAKIVREFGGDADKIVREVVFKNKRAFSMMSEAENLFDWLAVSVESFGKKELAPAENLLAIGDAAAFIDPFTGSGMLMAMESAEIVSSLITQDLSQVSYEKIAVEYARKHAEKFNSRLRVCSVLRRAAFMPNVASTIIHALSLSRFPRQILAKATRQATFGRSTS